MLAATRDRDAPGGRTADVVARARASRTWVLPRLGMLGVLGGLIIAFSILRPHQFATGFNARTLLGDSSTLIILVAGLTFVVVTAGIDLSVGSVLVFASVLSAKTMASLGGTGAGWDVILLGLLVGLLSGLAWGLANGVLVAKAKIPPLIVTLGSFGAALGLAQVITQGQDVQTVPDRLVSSVGTGLLFGAIPWIFVLAGMLALILGAVLALTRFGRHTYAVGSNPEAARRAGIAVDRHLIKVYALQWLLAGIAGWAAVARFAGTTISGHGTDNLDAIAAVAIGGTSLFGGTGWMLGSVVGVFIPAVLQNGFLIVGVQAYWQQVAVGAVLVAAVYLDQLRRRAAAQG